MSTVQRKVFEQLKSFMARITFNKKYIFAGLVKKPHTGGNSRKPQGQLCSTGPGPAPLPPTRRRGRGFSPGIVFTPPQAWSQSSDISDSRERSVLRTLPSHLHQVLSPTAADSSLYGKNGNLSHGHDGWMLASRAEANASDAPKRTPALAQRNKIRDLWPQTQHSPNCLLAQAALC